MKKQERKEVKRAFVEKFFDKKTSLLNALLLLFATLSLYFYNPYFVYFSQIHWIIFLSILVVAAFVSFYIFYKKILPLFFNIFYVVTITAIGSAVFGNMLDASMKEVKLLDTSHYKAAGSTKLNVKGKVKNIGSMAVQRCELSITLRAGTAPSGKKNLEPQKMFKPTLGLNFSFKSSIFDPDRYWSKTEKVLVIDKHLPKKGIGYFSKQIDFKKTVPYPIVRYHLSCQ